MRVGDKRDCHPVDVIFSIDNPNTIGSMIASAHNHIDEIPSVALQHSQAIKATLLVEF